MSISHFSGLDSLRFYAVFLVIFAHSFQIWTWQEQTLTLLPIGNLGVMIFFVLSGFLITRILISQPKEPIRPQLKTFYIRRALRIFPIYYLYLGMVFAFNLDNIQQAGILPWVYLTLKENPRSLQRLMVATLSIAILARGYLYAKGFSPTTQIEVFTLTNLDGLALGGLLALQFQQQAKTLIQKALPMIFTGLLGYYLLAWVHLHLEWHLLYLTLGKFLVVIFSAGLILLALNNPSPSLLHNRFTQHLGKISYGLYLYHNLIVSHAHEILNFLKLPLSPIHKLMMPILITLMIAQVSYSLIEKPFLKLKPQ